MDGCLQVGIAVPAECKRGGIQVLEIHGEMHDAAGMGTVRYTEEMGELVKRDLDGPFQDQVLGWPRLIQPISEPIHRYQCALPPLSGFAKDMGEDRNEEVHIDHPKNL